jgi:hypothetical protein
MAPAPNASRSCAWCKLEDLLQANESSVIPHARNVEGITGCDALVNTRWKAPGYDIHVTYDLRSVAGLKRVYRTLLRTGRSLSTVE